MAADPPHLDELQITSFTTSAVWGLVYNGLLQFKLGTGTDPDTFDVIPDIAKSYEHPDPLTYTFHLDDGVQFQDLPPVNGRTVTSDDVAYSLHRLATNSVGFTHSYMVSGLTSVQTPDPLTVTLKLSSPFPPLLTYLASLYGSIVPHELVDKYGDLKTVAIGTGPFILKQWQRNVKLQFERNPNYFRKSQPYLDGITLLIIPTVSGSLSSFQVKHIDIVGASDPSTAKTIESQNPDAHKASYLVRSGSGFRFRIDRPVFKDQRVRQAVVEGHNRPGEVASVDGAGFAEPSGPVSPSFPPFAKTPKQLGPPWEYDESAAKKLLSSAGLAQHPSVGVAITSQGHGQVEANAGAYYVQNLKALGFDAKIDDLVYATFLDQLYKGDHDIQRVSWPAAHDIDEWFTTFFNYSQAGAHSDNWDPTFSKLLQQEGHAADTESRAKAIDQLQTHLAQTCYIDMETVPMIHDYWQPYVMNYSPNGLIPIGWGSQVFRTVWLNNS